MKLDKHEILENLRSWSYCEIVDLFSDIFSNLRDEEIISDGSKRIYSAPAIAEFSTFLDGNISEYRLILAPDRSFEGAITENVTQDGFCCVCKSACAGFSKRSICSVCGNQVEMT